MNSIKREIAYALQAAWDRLCMVDPDIWYIVGISATTFLLYKLFAAL